jgi:hypothetical protein
MPCGKPRRCHAPRPGWLRPVLSWRPRQPCLLPVLFLFPALGRLWLQPPPPHVRPCLPHPAPLTGRVWWRLKAPGQRQRLRRSRRLRQLRRHHLPLPPLFQRLPLPRWLLPQPLPRGGWLLFRLRLPALLRGLQPLCVLRGGPWAR